MGEGSAHQEGTVLPGYSTSEHCERVIKNPACAGPFPFCVAIRSLLMRALVLSEYHDDRIAQAHIIELFCLDATDSVHSATRILNHNAAVAIHRFNGANRSNQRAAPAAVMLSSSAVRPISQHDPGICFFFCSGCPHFGFDRRPQSAMIVSPGATLERSTPSSRADNVTKFPRGRAQRLHGSRGRRR